MAESSGKNGAEKQLVELETVAIRFAGDSGDGMQLTGDQLYERGGHCRE